jgi:hypothetical protein
MAVAAWLFGFSSEGAANVGLDHQVSMRAAQGHGSEALHQIEEAGRHVVVTTSNAMFISLRDAPDYLSIEQPVYCQAGLGQRFKPVPVVN